jgi:DNA polymerase-3 subunit epsilon
LLNKKELENDVVDTLILARDKFPGSSVSLDALCKRYRIDNSKRVQHTALIDCELLSKVYINLIDQKEPTFNLVSSENNVSEKNNSKILYFKKVIALTEEELIKHKDYLKSNLKKNFFN